MGKWYAHGPDCMQCGRPQVCKGLCWACYKRERWTESRAQLPACTGHARGHHSWTTAGKCMACGAAKPRGWR